MAFKAGEGSGKSGSFFFFSHDRNFIIKTMTDGEYKTFIKLFKSYMSHLMKHKNSLIARIYGIFSVKIEKLETVHLIMMHNTIQNPMWKEIKLKYLFDLKGSLINRETKVNMKKYKPGSTLKDINLLSIRKSENLCKFSIQDRAKLIDILEKDAAILNKQKIMDYSLLLAVEKYQLRAETRDRNRTHNLSSSSICSENEMKLSKDPELKARFTAPNSPSAISKLTNCFVPSRHRFLSYSGEYIYHLAIIDYLQEYNFDKKSEHYAKTIFRGRGAEISAVPPGRYMKRFIEFMRDEVIIDDKSRGEKSQSSLT